MSTGGQIAISHKSLNATVNVSVGPLDQSEWRDKETRARGVRDFLDSTPGRKEDVSVDTSRTIGGESNTVVAEYTAPESDSGMAVKKKHGLISVFHNELEYAIQWSASPDQEPAIAAIMSSFKFITHAGGMRK